MYCQPSDYWSACAKRIKEVIRNTNDPAVALSAAMEWSQRYRALYLANPQPSWTKTDQERFETVLSDLWDDSVGKYLDPAGLAWDLMLKKYAPSLAAVLGWLSGPAATVIYIILAPSPLANDFTAAKADNDEINNLLRSKFPLPTQGVIQLRYTPYVDRAYQQCFGGGGLP